jgi:hypothetical protein
VYTVTSACVIDELTISFTRRPLSGRERNIGVRQLTLSKGRADACSACALRSRHQAGSSQPANEAASSAISRADPGRSAELANSLSMAALLLLEQLTPLGPGVFVPRDVYMSGNQSLGLSGCFADGAVFVEPPPATPTTGSLASIRARRPPPAPEPASSLASCLSTLGRTRPTDLALTWRTSTV